MRNDDDDDDNDDGYINYINIEKKECKRECDSDRARLLVEKMRTSHIMNVLAK
ncbi:hypothetical protein WH47_02277 [Habropoda laboriosa]|uniref:Uncharacterized protein n=1 Tax=Habropoda laboriosa TaxID=597456 RepID=A0A0L7QYS8_9HYME|nr:hypothetical protein WH47_02277 [Habropoda laboriosa]